MVQSKEQEMIESNQQMRNLNIEDREPLGYGQLLPQKSLLHKNLLQAGPNLPDLNAPITTKQFLAEVKSGECYMFHRKLVQKHYVSHPPPIRILQLTVVEQLILVKSKLKPQYSKSIERLIEHVKQRTANKNWYIEVLGIIQVETGLP